VLEPNAFQIATFPGTVDVANLQLQFICECWNALFGEQEFAGGSLRDGVLKIRMKRLSTIRGKRPLSRRPNQRVHVAAER